MVLRYTVYFVAITKFYRFVDDKNGSIEILVQKMVVPFLYEIICWFNTQSNI